MKLLNSFVSPFAARVRIAIYAHALPVDIAPSGQWLPDFQKSPDYLKINPIGRVPTLLLDDGTGIPESSVIIEYLADAFPGNGLRPSDPRAAARVRLLAHLAEIDVQLPANPLFAQFFAEQRDKRKIEVCVDAMNAGLSHLEHFLGDADGSPMTVADCALAPFLFFFADLMVATFGIAPIIGKHARVSAYWDRIQSDPSVERVLGEMRAAIVKSPLRALLPA